MSDQVAKLLRTTRQNQLGRPPTCPGRTPGATACTDNVIAEIIELETGRLVSPAQVRNATAREVCRGLRPSDALRALLAFGVRGYGYHDRVTAMDVIRATERGVVLVGVGYRLYPRQSGVAGPGAIAEYGGKTDVNFRGSHAVTVWGSRVWNKRPSAFPAGVKFVAGRRVWGRDPDHRQDYRTRYDRYLSRDLAAAMGALVTETPWTVTFAIWKG